MAAVSSGPIVTRSITIAEAANSTIFLIPFQRQPTGGSPRMLGVNHAMQMCGCVLNIEMLVLAGPAFCSENTAAVGIFEIAIRELVMALCVLPILVIYA